MALPASWSARPWRALPSALVGVLAAAISLTGSWIPSLWGDEAASLLSAERPLASLWQEVAHVDAVHALYYLLLHGWVDLFGTSPFALRMPSALAVGIACAGVVELGRRLAGIRLGIVAGLVAAVLPRVTYMGEEARSSAIATAVAVWLTVLLVALLHRRRRWDPLWIAYAALLVFGVYLFVYLALVALAHGIVVLATRDGRVGVRGAALAASAVAAAAVPLVLAVIRQRGQLSWLAGLDRSGPIAVTVDLWFGDAVVAVLGWALIVAAVVLAVRSPAARGRLVLIASLWLAVPVVALEVVNAVTPAFTPRYLSMCAPAAALLIAVPLDALVATRRRVIAVATAAALVIAIVPVWASQRTPFAKNDSDWAELGATISADASAGDGILFDESTSPSHRTRLAMRAYPGDFANVRDVDLARPFFDTTSWHDRTLRLAQLTTDGRLDGVDRLWVVEYRHPSGKTDRYAVGALERLGFRLSREIDEHTSEVLLLTRA